ncbi:SDR family NAD(P)-dependent oxidoreductase [Streptomyces sp. NPDC058108]|uniref:SDR family NAD(P)-dependent oxidoreductase n=1 Tax=Streptomyces sp. NPDC058108 TaxID=3346344 RepID=UPI0036E2C811
MPHAVVTGAAGGIGRAVAERFARAGYRLTLSDLDGPALRRAAADVDALPVPADLTEDAAPAVLVERAWEGGGTIDVLVNAAGLYPSLDMLDVTAENWDRLFALNLRAPVLATAAYGRRVAEARTTGAVVNISSGSALRSRPGGGPYATTKAALEMATRAAALEFGVLGIRVNAVSPGFVPVASEANPVSPVYAQAISANPLGRPGTPSDIAHTVHWLCTPEASWITGEVVRVDGGSSTGALHLPRIDGRSGHGERNTA